MPQAARRFDLLFGDVLDNPMPDPATVGHAAAWAAERGYWDVATCLMELAHALAELETPTPVRDPRPNAEAFNKVGGVFDDPRYVDQANPHPESRLRSALAKATGADDPRFVSYAESRLTNALATADAVAAAHHCDLCGEWLTADTIGAHQSAVHGV
jgi:hypothetical protein